MSTTSRRLLVLAGLGALAVLAGVRVASPRQPAPAPGAPPLTTTPAPAPRPVPAPSAGAPERQEDAWALHLYDQPGKNYRVLEVRPRRESFAAWRIALPIAEKDAIVDFRTGAPGTPPQKDEDHNRIAASVTDPEHGELWMVGTDETIGPERSAYLGVRRKPSVLYVGARGQPFRAIDPGKLTL